MKKKINLLIVDDHHLVRKGLKLILNDQDDIMFSIKEVDDGNKALKHIQENKTDIILMDITMPTMNGIDATRQIIEYRKSSKIIALSMHSETHLIKKMIEAGANGYLLKDTETYELVKAIKTVISGSQYFSNAVSLKLIGQLNNPQKKEDAKKDKTELQLSKRESQILTLISKELTNEEIAIELNISKRTVDTHRQKMLAKFNVKNTAGLVMFGMRNNLIS